MYCLQIREKYGLTCQPENLVQLISEDFGNLVLFSMMFIYMPASSGAIFELFFTVLTGILIATLE